MNERGMPQNQFGTKDQIVLKKQSAENQHIANVGCNLAKITKLLKKGRYNNARKNEPEKRQDGRD